VELVSGEPRDLGAAAGFVRFGLTAADWIVRAEMLTKVSSGKPAAGELPLSIVIPIFNEQSILLANAEALANYLDNMLGSGNWLYIFVDNGSTDGTPALLKHIVERWPLSRVINLKSPNYGAALKAGLRAATTKWVYMLDIDQWDLPFMTWAWNSRQQYDLFIASKRADPTLNFQAPYRRFLSAGLNAALQVLFHYSGTDTHGPKLLDRESLNAIVAKCELDRGQFDTELVLRAMRNGKRLVEVPVEYREFRPHRNLMIKKIFWNLMALRRLRHVMRDVPFEGAVRYYRLAREDVLAQHQSKQLVQRESDTVGARRR
jgi:glycosyltransferase involved in cell wall biosynthesis